MISVFVSDVELFDMFEKRLRHWICNKDICELYLSYISKLIRENLFEDMTIDINKYIDDLYTNDTRVITLQVLREEKIDEKDILMKRSCEREDLFLVYNK